MHRKISALIVLVAFGLVLSATPAQASNSWSNWHWKRASNPFTVKILDSTSDGRTPIGGQNWPAALTKAAADWTQSTVLDMAVQPQTAADLAVREACPFSPGAVRVCNVLNPDVTWLGLATVVPDPQGSAGHILAATAQMNDTWFTTPLYNATNAQQVMCQEVGHTIGLDHQDASGKDLNTCMDYATALDNPSPNTHDYQQLQTIYGQLDGGGATTSTSGGAKASNKGGKNSSKVEGWSPSPLQFPDGYHGTGNHGRPHSDTYVTQENGLTIVRYVLWAY